ncbi:hypothetical protein [Adlercreutzia sp. ZJ138]|uniref:hypothetical protein n=1 Tax=Adlercreutzia sp. ZJ138 TaxID=2709405 RepID=UPI0013EA71B4|nr:hypothetical protein [Adlercreutzia sp. ZJ138]
MTQRNPMNERYTVEGKRKGTTRKSAASAKPTTKAASSVRIESTSKKKKGGKAATPKQKAEEKQTKARVREIEGILERKYYTPPTNEFKQARRAWWCLLIVAIICTIGTWVGQGKLPTPALYSLLFAAYAGIIGALVLDFTKIRKMRNAYLQQMSGAIAKDRRILEKAQKEADAAEARGEKIERSQFLAQSIAVPELPKRKGLFGKNREDVPDKDAQQAQEAKEAEEAKRAESAKRAEDTKQAKDTKHAASTSETPDDNKNDAADK